MCIVKVAQTIFDGVLPYPGMVEKLAPDGTKGGVELLPCQFDLEMLREEDLRLQSEIDTIEAEPGPQGEEGPAGPQGETGAAGPQGEPGSDWEWKGRFVPGFHAWHDISKAPSEIFSYTVDLGSTYPRLLVRVNFCLGVQRVSGGSLTTAVTFQIYLWDSVQQVRQRTLRSVGPVGKGVHVVGDHIIFPCCVDLMDLENTTSAFQIRIAASDYEYDVGVQAGYFSFGAVPSFLDVYAG